MLGTYRRGEEVEIPAARAALGMFWAKKGLAAPIELLDIGMSRFGLRKYLDEERRRQHVERASWRIVSIYRFRRERVQPRSGQRYRQRRCFKCEIRIWVSMMMASYSRDIGTGLLGFSVQSANRMMSIPHLGTHVTHSARSSRAYVE